jgi:hypothetical protein
VGATVAECLLTTFLLVNGALRPDPKIVNLKRTKMKADKKEVAVVLSGLTDRVESNRKRPACGV